MRNLLFRGIATLALLFVVATTTKAQFLMDMIDTSKSLGKGMLGVYKKFDHISITGYFQPQYQLASDSGIVSYAGGNFAPSSDNRFTIRRGRIRFDYAHFTKDSFPALQLVFQFEGSEKGVFIRDFWGRVWDTKWHLFHLTTGMFARPFGYEVNLASADREAPERGRMSQTLLKGERDLGVMAGFEPQVKDNPLHKLKIDAGIFNGQGITSTVEYDSYKDFVGQVYWKPTNLTTRLLLSGGVSYLNGGLSQTSNYRYETKQKPGGEWANVADSGHKPGSRMPRIYYGANAQLKLKHSWGATEFRAEYWQGTQTAVKFSSETPGAIVSGEHQYIREFKGGFICFLQNIVNDKNQLILKYDWYDPNRRVNGKSINAASEFTIADVQYNTFGFGALHHFNKNLKLLLYYDLVKNESTSLTTATDDISDNVLTLRLQFRF